MSFRLRYLWNRFSRLKLHYKSVAAITTYKIQNIRSVFVPCTLAFSVYTLLRSEDKLSAEDELIQTIKHCVLFIQRSEYDKAEQLLHVALRQAQLTRHELGITYIYDVMANLALEREQLDKAKKLFVTVSQRIMADGATEDDLRIVHISAKLARISHLKKEYETAQLGYDWCLNKLNVSLKAEPSNDTAKLIALTEDWYGRLFFDCNQWQPAYNFMLSAFNRMKQIPDMDKDQLALQINDIGTLCDLLGKTDESIECFKEALEIDKTTEDKNNSGAIYVNLGRAYLKKNLIEDARKNCGFAWRIGVTTKNNEIKTEAEHCIDEIKKSS